MKKARIFISEKNISLKNRTKKYLSNCLEVRMRHKIVQWAYRFRGRTNLQQSLLLDLQFPHILEEPRLFQV